MVLIERHPGTNLCGYLATEDRWAETVDKMRLADVRILNQNFNAHNCVKMVKRYLKYLSYDPKTHFKLIYQEADIDAKAVEVDEQ